MTIRTSAIRNHFNLTRYTLLFWVFVGGFSPCPAQVYKDHFSRNSLNRYHIAKNVSWDSIHRALQLGLGASEVYTRKAFGNNIDVTARVFIPIDGGVDTDQVSLAVFDKGNDFKYLATLAYGRNHEKNNHIFIQLKDSWGECHPITFTTDTWYIIRLTASVSNSAASLKMKAWQENSQEPALFQVSRNLSTGFRADGGIGFSSSGNSTLADDLVVHRSQWVAPVFNYTLLPRPVLKRHPDWIQLYWNAWKIASGKIQFGTPGNGFVNRYLDEGYSDNIFQWDTCFMMFFAKYAQGFLPSIVSLDNFYRKQHPSGAICREISESDGSDFWPTKNLTFTNPPLFAWAEWEYYQYTGDAGRFLSVLPVLDAYFQWCKQERASREHGLYYWTNLASGMDNSPRPEATLRGWIDYSAQQAMAASYISRMASVIKDKNREAKYRTERENLKTQINTHCWNMQDGYYWDVDATGKQIKVKTAACFWPMFSGIADSSQAKALVQHLMNPLEFYRPHLFPTLSADHLDYILNLPFWCRGVWASANVMYIKGLQFYGYEDLAQQATANHLDSEGSPHFLLTYFA